MSTLPSVNLNALYAATGSGATGIDVAGAVNQILYARRATERQWQYQQSVTDQQTAALNQLSTAASRLMNWLDELQNPTGSLMTNSVGSSQSNVITASATPAASTGNHIVVVEALATRAAWYSDAVKDGATSFASGSFDLTVGSGTSQSTTTIVLGNGIDTPTDLVQHINGLKLGITAALVTDANGTRVALTSDSSGSASDFSVAQTQGSQNTNVFTRAATGNNASLTVDGVPISSATNSVTGVINGVTLNLKSQAPGNEVVLTVGPDMAGAQQTVNNFVSSYNSLVQQVNAQFAYDSVNQTSGPLGSDTTVRMLQSALLGSPGYSDGQFGFSTLRSMGISMNDDGTLAVDSGTLSSALQNNPGAVQVFFQGTSLDGFAGKLRAALDHYSDSSEGAFTVDLKSLSDTKADLQQHIDDFEAYLVGEQTRLTAEYNEINIILLQLPQQQKQINAILGYNSGGSNNS